VIYLGADVHNEGFAMWSHVQLSIIQTQVLGLLVDLIPFNNRDFALENGPYFVVDLLKNLIAYQKTIDSDRFDLIRVHISLLETCLLLLTTLSERGPMFKKMLSSFDIFNHLFEILIEDSQTVKIWSKSLMICSSLCHGYKLNKGVFGKVGGVKAIISFLKYIVFNRYESCNEKDRALLILATVECIWGSICGNQEFEDSFISQDGTTFLTKEYSYYWTC
jgi:hypothetical protein